MSFRDSISWQKSVDLVILVYSETSTFPKSETFGLQGQMRRTALSIPSNLAEGYGRSSTNEYMRFIDIALGSLRELQTQIEIAKLLKMIDAKQLEDSPGEIGRILYSARKTLRLKANL
jgi:four helix bundle protein